MEIKTITDRKTKYNAYCIGFCPVETFEHIFVVGTYELVNVVDRCELNVDADNIYQWLGCLELYSIKESELKILQQVGRAGILEARWCTHEVDGRVLLGVADCNGHIIVYSLENGNCLKELCKVSVTQNRTLSLDWSTALTPCNSPLLTVSDSDGYINIFSMERNDLRFVQKFKAHRNESEITSFNYWNTNIVYTGGEDGTFKGYDIQSNAVQIFSFEIHTAGVTAIQHSLRKEYLLFSGCYNGILNTWDLRNMKNSLSLTELEGGVTSLRSEPFKRPLLVASAMYSGFRILEIDENDKPKIIDTYRQDIEGLAEGADWSRAYRGSKHMISSVSFYDNLLSVWEFEY